MYTVHLHFKDGSKRRDFISYDEVYNFISGLREKGVQLIEIEEITTHTVSIKSFKDLDDWWSSKVRQSKNGYDIHHVDYKGEGEQ